MGRYSANNDDSWPARIMGWLLIGLLGMWAVAGAARGVQWLWQHFVHA